MHIIVCVKQVPDTANVRINPETNTLIREGVESIMNPFDEYALEEALKLKDEHGARVTVITMGPPQAGVILREAMARGADDAVLLTDRAIAGADTLATSYILSLAIRKLNTKPDLVLFGKQAIDGDTAQVGPGVSEFLKYPLVTYVKSLTVKDGVFTAETMMDEGVDVLEGKLPVVMTVVKEASTPRFASLGGWINAKETEIPAWGAKEIEADIAQCGLDGSPTKVVKIFAPPVKTGGKKMDGLQTPGDAVNEIVRLLKEKGGR
ncbi:MAG: electron transfer flavoprotein subunit beta/FixA family protein [Acidobacteriota bacterium]|jgi:electron transfer flavoprotein beta subunit|nr:electron transfer flavoprotein subunit beta/FixA family protein [Acidobacteriota bacterium]